MNLKLARKILAQAAELLGNVRPEAKEPSEADEQARPAEPSDPCRAVNRLPLGHKELPPFSITYLGDSGQTD